MDPMTMCFRVWCVGLAAILLQATTPIASAQGNPAMRPIEDVPDLPRLLIIGDSISIDYTLPLREALAGKANVHRIAANARSSSHTLEHLDDWLGEGNWDVIVFNVGLHDVNRRTGQRLSSPEQYRENLKTLAARLKATNAKLLWARTTPIPTDAAGGYRAGDEVEYNDIADQVMKEAGIQTCDLHAPALAKLADWQRPRDVHFHNKGSKELAGILAPVLSDLLKR
jgi:lysophospholipase L1-like esterase